MFFAGSKRSELFNSFCKIKVLNLPQILNDRIYEKTNTIDIIAH